mgnify:CR=1 FL=1
MSIRSSIRPVVRWSAILGVACTMFVTMFCAAVVPTIFAVGNDELGRAIVVGGGVLTSAMTYCSRRLFPRAMELVPEDLYPAVILGAAFVLLVLGPFAFDLACDPGFLFRRSDG